MQVKELLFDLIKTPSFSKEEEGTAKIIQKFFEDLGINTNQIGNNIWVKNKFFDPDKPNLLLNSHHDTVKPKAAWTKDPFLPTLEGNKLIGLGSNDAGASLVCLIQTFVDLYENIFPFNILLVASAEEEISGKNGIEVVLNDPNFPKIDFGIVGEPTECKMAVAEKGLMVIDAKCLGMAGHAARNEGINAIDLALEDIQSLKNIHFDKVSDLLGPVKCTVTIINAGEQHNVIPAECHFTIDCRVNEEYSLEEVLGILRNHLKAELTPRSIRLQSSKLATDHPLFLAGKEIGLSHYGSPTLSDQALMPFPTLKIGPGKSERSHTADEFILMEELEEGVNIYKNLISKILK